VPVYAPGSGSSSVGTGRQEGYLYDRGGAFFNVMHSDFGATGDGTTDESTAIQAVITAAPTNSVIWLPPGTFRLVTGLSINNKTNLMIAGPGKLAPEGAITCIDIVDSNFITVRDIEIDGDATAGSTAIKFRSTGTTVLQCHIVGMDIADMETGITAPVGGDPHELVVIRNRLTVTDMAGSVGVSAAIGDSIITDNVIRGFDSSCLVNRGGTRVARNHFYRFPSTAVTRNLGIGLEPAATEYLSVYGNFFDGYPTEGNLVLHAGFARGVSIFGNTFLSDDTEGPFIHFKAPSAPNTNITDVSIIGNSFKSPTGSKTNGMTLSSDVITNASSRFRMHSNTWRGASPFSTDEADRQTGAFATSYTPNPMLGRTIVLTLTDNITINNASNANMGGIGNRLTFVFIQDGTGGRTVGWNAAYKQGWSDTGNTSDLRSTITFEFDGTNWNQVGAQSPYV
jgi:hypothetical protein